MINYEFSSFEEESNKMDKKFKRAKRMMGLYVIISLLTSFSFFIIILMYIQNHTKEIKDMKHKTLVELHNDIQTVKTGK